MLNPSVLSSEPSPKFTPTDFSAICIRVLKFVTPVDFSSAYKLYGDPSAYRTPTELKPWIHEGALLPASDAQPSAGLLQPFKDNGEGVRRARCRYLEYLWHWQMPKDGGRASWERAVGETGQKGENGDSGRVMEKGKVEDVEGEVVAGESGGGGSARGNGERAVRTRGHLSNVTLALRGLRTVPEGMWDF